VLKVDQALADKQISGMMLICYENDRPLQGAIAELDWRLNGHFSRLIKKQVLTGSRGEALYAPLLWNDRTLHFLVIGGGNLASDSKRKTSSAALLERALKKLDELKLSGLAISARDWNISENPPGIKERGLCVVH
jgi:hypothetical protein